MLLLFKDIILACEVTFNNQRKMQFGLQSIFDRFYISRIVPKLTWNPKYLKKKNLENWGDFVKSVIMNFELKPEKSYF